jgi:hypothetical protein
MAAAICTHSSLWGFVTEWTTESVLKHKHMLQFSSFVYSWCSGSITVVKHCNWHFIIIIISYHLYTGYLLKPTMLLGYIMMQLFCFYNISSSSMPSVTSCDLFLLFVLYADPGGRAVWGVGVRPPACSDCGFESRGSMNVCLLWVMCVVRYREGSATGWSHVQRSPTECGVSECNRGTSYRRPRPTRAVETWKKFFCMFCRLRLVV